MVVREMVPKVLSVGAIDWERRLFDALIPLPDGTSYNAYLVQGSEKTALIETVDPSAEYDLVKNLVDAKVEKIDYLVVNHAEQDHSGSLPIISELFPQAQIVCSEKCRELLPLLLDIDPERILTVRDRDTLPLGDRTLEFFLTPWVHWPETMLTYLQEDRILFPCDLFGSHFATSELFVNDPCLIATAAKRYYAEIMMPFRNSIRTYLETLSGLSIDIIAPSHGPCHRPSGAILQAYRDWTSDDVRNDAVLLYVSMHGSTGKMIHHLADALIARGVRVHLISLSGADLGSIAMALVDAATVVIGTPTVLFGPHPDAVHATYIANAIRPKTRFISVIGSYGWGGKTIDILTGMLTHLKAETIEPVMIRGAPGAADFRALETLAEKIAAKHRELGLI